MSRDRHAMGLTSSRFTKSALWAIAAALVASCGAPAEPGPDGGASTAVHESQPSETADPSVVQALSDVGIYSGMIIEVSNVGDENGFIVDTRSPTWAERTNFAYMSYLACRDVADGEDTWDNIRENSISTGATEEEADSMIVYWEENFCPAVTGIPRDDDPLVGESISEGDDTVADGTALGQDARFQAAELHCDLSDVDYSLDSGELIVYDAPREDLGQPENCLLAFLGLPDSTRGNITRNMSGEDSWNSPSSTKWTIVWEESDFGDYYFNATLSDD